ncbi:MAG TPA: hypothetical protein VK253_09010, partial [Candidatus Binatia bacterium]|nr:hypothetical protein [Candidatus Binatia bacterium]
DSKFGSTFPAFSDDQGLALAIFRKTISESENDLRLDCSCSTAEKNIMKKTPLFEFEVPPNYKRRSIGLTANQKQTR